jgi:hypothetical protein
MSMYRKNYAVRLHKKSTQTDGLVQVGESSSCVVPWRQSGIRYVKIPGVRQAVRCHLGFLVHSGKPNRTSPLCHIIVLTSAPTQDAQVGPAPISHTSPSQTCPCPPHARAVKIRRASLPDHGKVVPQWMTSIPLGPPSPTR